MRSIFLILIISALIFLAACQKSSSTTLANKSTTPANSGQIPTDPAADVPRITAADAKKEFDAEAAVFVDTRSEYAYNIEHIKGALNIPLEKFEERYKDIPTGKKIIGYCDCRAEHTSAILVLKLKEKGIEDAYALIDGTKGWILGGYPTEKKEPNK